MQLTKLKNSIATRLLKIIFGLYLIVTIIITALQMVTEYELTQNTVHDEIKTLPQTYGPSLGEALWTFNKSSLHNLLVGMKQIPTVTGVQIKHENEITAIGLIENDSDEYIEYDSNHKVIQNVEKTKLKKNIPFQFPVSYKDNNGELIFLGTGIIYTSTDVILSRVIDGFILIIVGAILKTIAFWLIFIYVIRRILAKPLLELTLATSAIDLDNIDDQKIHLDSQENDELHQLEQAFNTMLDKLAASKSKLDKYNEHLELTVDERTQDLQLEIKARKKAQTNAEHANELKDMFVANVSHELRTPMTSIYGMVRYLGSIEEDKEKHKSLMLVERNCQRLITLINQLLDFAKIQSGTLNIVKETFELDECLNDIVNSLKPLIQDENVSLNLETAPLPDNVFSDKSKLQQILINLVGNAIKFTHQGSITIKVNLYPENNEMLQIDIIDTGIGISEDNLGSLFDEFIQVDGSSSRKYGGTGLGLAISKSYIELIGGEIWVGSKPDEGSTFSFTLPYQA